jgi:hypothetical protein
MERERAAGTSDFGVWNSISTVAVRSLGFWRDRRVRAPTQSGVAPVLRSSGST